MSNSSEFISAAANVDPGYGFPQKSAFNSSLFGDPEAMAAFLGLVDLNTEAHVNLGAATVNHLFEGPAEATAASLDIAELAMNGFDEKAALLRDRNSPATE